MTLPRPGEDALPLPSMFREGDVDVPYTPGQLAPTVERLRTAIQVDLRGGTGTPQQRLAAAWTRIAELRLPRKAVPAPVLDAIEDLLMRWAPFAPGGIQRCAASLSEEEVRAEAVRLLWMLQEVERAAAEEVTAEVVPTE